MHLLYECSIRAGQLLRRHAGCSKRGMLQVKLVQSSMGRNVLFCVELLEGSGIGGKRDMKCSTEPTFIVTCDWDRMLTFTYL